MTPADITNEIADALFAQKKRGPIALGMDPEAGLPVYSMIGPFGPYVQLGDKGEDDKKKPKRVSIPKQIDAQQITLAQALDLLSLPRTLGDHPESGKPVKAAIGRFGPYVVHEKVFKSLPKDQDVLKIDLATAVELLKQARTRQGATPIKELGAHPEDGQPIQVFAGKYGPYVKHGKVNATIPKEMPVEEVTLSQALSLIEARAARGGGSSRRGSRRPAPKAAARKKAPKKAVPKEAAPKNATVKPSKKAAAKKAPAKKAAKKKPPEVA
jgi:DNA topoisomerase-1